MSMIGQCEPQWCATAHLKGDEVNLSSQDYQGKWHVLYWYPLDFTFVCPTEIRGFQSLLDAFGVLKEDQGVAYRATIVIDDQGLIRSTSVNDLTAGRSPSEVLRTVQALQSGGLCGTDWRPGEAFVG